MNRSAPSSGASRPSPGLMLSVGLVAASMLLVEIIVTRVFSVLFFYHYSSFAIALIMSGLSFGGLLAARWNNREQTEDRFKGRLAGLAAVSAGFILAALGVVLSYPPQEIYQPPSLLRVAVLAIGFLPGLTTAGAFLAAAFSRREDWIGRLYATDLLCAAAACLAAILVMRTVQGPAGLLVPALFSGWAGFALSSRRSKTSAFSGLIILAAVAGIVVQIATGGKVLRMRVQDDPFIERWNEHSRILVFDKTESESGMHIVIDKTAGTTLPHLAPRPPGTSPYNAKWKDWDVADLAYRTGRPMDQVAIIGFGGGINSLAPVAFGARRVDAYELNGIILDLHRKSFLEYSGLANWPEISLIHSEARAGIAHAGKKYDVIQASMIDTWAATASGGFVLSENGLYTLEGWQVFLSSLTDRGLLTMTRWFLPHAPAETHRLVSLAAAALAKQGIRDPRAHIVLAASGKAIPPGVPPPVENRMATILVSKVPFSVNELIRIDEVAAHEEMHLLVAPGLKSPDPAFDLILNPETRPQAIAKHRFDISPPTDLRPYFFLMIRPWDVWKFKGGDRGVILEITMNGTRIMLILGCFSLLFALVVLILAQMSLPAPSPSREALRAYQWSSLYFLGIGLGYIFIQLGLHQRLSLILGHPTLALSVVLFSMLLGTGLGSAASSKLFPHPKSFWRAWVIMLAALLILILTLPFFPGLETLNAFILRAGASALILGATGFVLGFGFPLGVRLVAPAGEWGVQKMWAVNGAATIAGSAMASILGLAMGSRTVLVAGFVCYLFAAAAGMMCRRIRVEDAT